MTARTLTPRRTLLGLDWRHDHFYLVGDPEERPVYPTPIGAPKVIEGMPFGTPYSEQVVVFTEQAPAGATAFILGPPLPVSVGDPGREYAVIAQFCMIDEDVLERARTLPLPDWAITGFVYQDGRLGWVRQEPARE